MQAQGLAQKQSGSFATNKHKRDENNIGCNRVGLR